MKQKNLWLTVGIPGSGKSWFVENEFDIMTKSKSTIIISRDAVRYAVLDTLGGEYFDHEKQVFKNFVDCIKAALNNDAYENIVADATHLTPASRNKILSQIDLSFVSVNFILTTTSLNICLKRNANRKGRRWVPEDVIKDMSKSLSYPLKKELDKYKTKEIIILDETGASLLRKE